MSRQKNRTKWKRRLRAWGFDSNPDSTWTGHGVKNLTLREAVEILLFHVVKDMELNKVSRGLFDALVTDSELWDTGERRALMFDTGLYKYKCYEENGTFKNLKDWWVPNMLDEIGVVYER